MAPRQHSHPKHIQLFKNIFAILAFLYPAYMLLTLIPGIAPNSGLKGISVVIVAFFSMIFILVAAYFFQDILVDEEGLLIEFLWQKVRVRWSDVEEIKSNVFGSGWIVVVNKLTPFHRIFGLIYGFTIKPAFVVAWTLIDRIDREVLQKDIRSHIDENRELHKK